jgi:Flp pilus assembly pilin Flp
MARSGFQKEQTGAAMIEMTIVAALLLTLVLGFVDFGFAFYQWNAATKAVQVGARLAVVSTPVPTGLIAESNTTDVSLVGVQMSPGQFSYSCTADAAGVASCTRCDADDVCTAAGATQADFDLIYGGDRVSPIDCSAPSPGRPGMCDFFPALDPENVRIEYVATGLGYWTRPGGPVPTVRVSLQNVQFQFFFLSGLLGFGQIAMPSMLSTITGEDLSTTF